ncbi:oligopeptide/dipeptide ABC transporter ATP-binding protein [Nonomuraea sp. NPDC026600]|uniref:oligopeptide/dipeptide ABC transporter ATP-binding protein n=1 Tax=Nonomuraea sp. NPDC026600 TaxID=3155363 RepID=UPI0033E31729
MVVQRDILAEIRALREEYGFAVVFITHDLSLLMEISDRIATMYSGRVVETGTAKALHRTPRHPYTLGLLRSFPRLRGRREELLGIPDTPPDLRSPPPGCAFHPRCAMAVAECSESLPALRAEADGEVACLLNDGRGVS